MQRLKTSSEKMAAAKNIVAPIVTEGKEEKKGLTFEEFSQFDRKSAFNSREIGIPTIQRNILQTGNKGIQDISGFIPLNILSYLSLQFDLTDIESKVVNAYKDVLSEVKITLDGKNKEKTFTIDGIIRKDVMFKQNKETGSIFDRANHSITSIIDNEILDKRLKPIMEKGNYDLLFDVEGKVFVRLSMEEIIGSILLPTMVTSSNDIFENIDAGIQYVKERIYNYVKISDIVATEEKINIALIFESDEDCDLVINVDTKTFTALNISCTLDRFRALALEQINYHTSGKGTSNKIDIKFVDVEDIVASNRRNSDDYAEIIKITGIDEGMVRTVPMIYYGYDDFIVTPKKTGMMFDRSNRAAAHYDSVKVLTDPFWKYLTTAKVYSYIVNKKPYFLPDFKKLALATFFGNRIHVSPLAVGKAMFVSIATKGEDIAFAIAIGK